jgi:hypothetical protein
MPAHPRPAKLEPEEPAVARQREAIVKALLQACAKASEPVLPLLRKMHDVLVSTRPNAVYREDAHKQAVEAYIEIVRRMQSTGKPIEVPDIVAEANQFLTDHALQLQARLEKAGLAVPEDPNAQAKLAAIAIAVSGSNADGMSTAQAKGPSTALGAIDVPPNAATAVSNKEVPAELKGWVNPEIGKIGSR